MARDCWRVGAARRAPPPPPFLAQDRIFYRRECRRSCESRVVAADHDRKPSGAVTDWSGMSACDELGLLPSPLAGEGWGGGWLAHRILSHAPSLSLQPKSDLSDFGQFIHGRTRVNPSSAASGEGNTACAVPFDDQGGRNTP